MAKIIERVKNWLPFEIHRKMNNPSIPTGLPLYPTGDKPIIFATEAILFWLECAPVATAVNKIAREIASIKPKLWDNQKEIFVDDHPIFDILSKPDSDMTYKEFMEAITIFYLVTGNVYLRSLGYIENPPKTIRVVPSQGVTIVANYDGYKRNIITRILALIDNFDKFDVEEQGQIRHRYYTQDKLKELYHIRTFNPYIGSNMVYGVSPLNHVFYEMRQYIDSAKHNLSTLQRGTRASGIFKIKNRILPQEQRQRLEEQINYALGGANNAGRNLLLNEDVDFQDMIKNSRDMDYANMKEQVTIAIYNALHIPLPLIDPEHMTLDNMTTAKLSLYDNAVLPITRRIFEELTNFLMPRYGDTEGRYELSFQEDDIPALLPRKNEQMKVKKDSGIFTVNELRNEWDADPMDGGNDLLGPSTLTPIARDSSGTFKVDDLEKEDAKDVPRETQKEDPEQEETEKKPEAKTTRARFSQLLKNKKDENGNPMFTDEEINKIADKHGLQ